MGQVDLPEGPRVQAVLSGGPGDFRIGMEMELELETLRENKEGQDVVIHRFRPVGGAEVKLENVAVLGVGMTRFGVYRDRSNIDLAREAGLAALRDAGISFDDVGEAFVGYLGAMPMTGMRAMKEFGLTGLPVTHVENASATGLVAFRDAAWAVASGRCQVAMALGFDKMTRAERGAGRRTRCGPRRDRQRDPAGGLLLALGHAAHARARHQARALRRDRRQELELRREEPLERPPARSRGDGR